MKWLAVALAALASVTDARANGRPPLTNGVHFRPSDMHSLYVASTFGLLVSHDDGCTFAWICDDNLGIGGMFDPQYAIAADGAIFATSIAGLRVSRDDGCSFQTATTELPVGDPGRVDVFVDALAIGPDGTVWIGTADASKPPTLYSSTDNGRTFTARYTNSPAAFWDGLAVAPSDAMRVYASGAESGGSGNPAVPQLLVSKDGGGTWTPSPLANVTYGVQPALQVIAVDPTNADVVYMVSIGANTPTGDLLYRSADGGATWTAVLAAADTIRDVAVADAQHVFVATQNAGSFRSGDGGATFAALAGTPQLECLGVRGDGALVGCGANWGPDFMAVSRSADLGGSWAMVWRFVQLDGPAACPAGTAEQDTCALQQWSTLKQQFGASGPICGSNVWPGDPSPPSHHGGGCCDAGASASASLMFAIVVSLRLRRRGRRSA
jgi:hypothetical protein